MQYDKDVFGEYTFLAPEKVNDISGLYNTGVITLIDRKYKDFDAKLSNNPLPRFKVHKSFLKKNTFYKENETNWI